MKRRSSKRGEECPRALESMVEAILTKGVVVTSFNVFKIKVGKDPQTLLLPYLQRTRGLLLSPKAHICPSMKDFIR